MMRRSLNSISVLALIVLVFSSTAAVAYEKPSRICAVEGFLSFDIAMLRGMGDASREEVGKAFEFLGPSAVLLLDQQFEMEATDGRISVYKLALMRMWDRSDACTENGPQLTLSAQAVDEIYKHGQATQQRYRRVNR